MNMGEKARALIRTPPEILVVLSGANQIPPYAQIGKASGCKKGGDGDIQPTISMTWTQMPAAIIRIHSSDSQQHCGQLCPGKM